MLPLNVMVLVFAIIAIVKLRQSVESTMLDVFLPVLLLVPAIYTLHIPHLPAISCYDAVLIPVGFAALLQRLLVVLTIGGFSVPTYGCWGLQLRDFIQIT
jgi:hypothetical protein